MHEVIENLPLHSSSLPTQSDLANFRLIRVKHPSREPEGVCKLRTKGNSIFLVLKKSVLAGKDNRKNSLEREIEKSGSRDSGASNKGWKNKGGSKFVLSVFLLEKRPEHPVVNMRRSSNRGLAQAVRNR